MNRTVDLLFEILVRSGPRKSNDSGLCAQCVSLVGMPTRSRILSLKIIAERCTSHVDDGPCCVPRHYRRTRDDRQDQHNNYRIYNEIAGQRGRDKSVGPLLPGTYKRKLCARSYLRSLDRESSFLVEKATGAVSGDCSAIVCRSLRAVPDRIKVSVRTVGCLGVGHGPSAYAAKAAPVGHGT